MAKDRTVAVSSGQSSCWTLERLGLSLVLLTPIEGKIWPRCATMWAASAAGSYSSSSSNEGHLMRRRSTSTLKSIGLHHKWHGGWTGLYWRNNVCLCNCLRSRATAIVHQSVRKTFFSFRRLIVSFGRYNGASHNTGRYIFS